ncbi:glycosyltransferase family 2 protein [Sunxiuqinia rutila]|uniref:glycosyltransferase family 2 protein n=1 Tax=Sunxiuqinia rutila TaxID=1397841 RepID=UPI003D36330A
MKLSIVIVNYNVRYFLEQCLHAVQKACTSIETEIFVVDNNSVDGSAHMVREKFPTVHLIENHGNKGFSKANNQAIRQAKGDYILLLNPDTLVEEDCFVKCLDFMDNHPEAGGLGVPMIDGKGRFLPESKRGLPTPEVAFYKIFGLARLFSHSPRFARYHMGHLDKNQTHEVDVLAGAFMLLRHAVLEKTGLLDEDYFMYGEDIDLSYRITQAGFKNYYFAGTTIIHYKGESTKKGSINYVKIFYQAMSIFAGKHFSKGRAGMFSFLINLAIYFRALLALTSRFAKAIAFPAIDALILFSGFLWLLPYWEQHKYTPDYYPPAFLRIVVPIYILIWLSAIGLSKAYAKPIQMKKLAKGILWGSIGILIFHSLADESLRFSRALILLGTVWAFLSLLSYRYLLRQSQSFKDLFDRKHKKRVMLVASEEEAQRISQLLKQSLSKIKVAGRIQPNRQPATAMALGNLDQIREAIRIHNIEELIFSAIDLPSQQIINLMLELSATKVDFKIAPPQSHSIIGSSSIDTAGDLYVVHLNAITKEHNQQNKRLLDFLLSLFFLCSYPILCWTIKQKKGFFNNIWQVIGSSKSWVGYSCYSDIQQKLPKIKPGILSPVDMLDEDLSEEKKQEINMVYAKNYSILQDVEIIVHAWKNLGR